jgi:hypothetical protein
VHFCLQPYALCLIYLVITFTCHLFSALAEYQPYVYSTLLFSPVLKPAAQKEKMDWNSSTRSSRLCVAPVAIPVGLWSLSLFHFVESCLSLQGHYLCDNYTLYS